MLRLRGVWGRPFHVKMHQQASAACMLTLLSPNQSDKLNLLIVFVLLVPFLSILLELSDK